jgi:hypothetical protein
MNVRAAIAYAGRGIARPRYHANDSRRDLIDIAPIDMEIADGRTRGRRAGFNGELILEIVRVDHLQALVNARRQHREPRPKRFRQIRAPSREASPSQRPMESPDVSATDHR